MKRMCSAAWLFGLLILAAACRKRPDPTPISGQLIDSGGIEITQLRVQFSPMMNGAPLRMDSAWYRNAAGDSFQVREHKYYVSNFTLQTDSGATVKIPESYLLVDARDVRPRDLPGVPPGTYNRISFLLGVDSARNVSGAQTGDLEQSKGMFWDWDAGYIMAKMEGTSPQSTLSGGELFFHIAGFSGKYKVLRTITLEFPMPLVLKPGQKPIIQLQSDLGSWFSGPPPFSFADFPRITTPGPEASAVADNYSKGFRVVRIDP